MPWQRQVLDVALEVDPSTGQPAYREVVLTVPRQSGKTTLVLPLILHRMLAPAIWTPRQTVVYTAQTRGHARRKWERDFVADIEDSKRLVAGRDYKVRRQLGDEGIFFPRTRGLFAIESTTEKAGHGGTLDLPLVDEAFAQEDDRLEQAFKPAMSTRADAQLYVISTAGTPKSVYLKSKVETGRALVEAGETSGLAYFEWSADENADPDDPATWYGCMPALGQPGMVTERVVAADRKSMKDGEFRRAYLNQWSDEITVSVIPLSWWRARVDESSRLVGRPVFAVDVSADRSRAAIVACGANEAGVPHLEVIEHGTGTDWCRARLVELMRAHRGRAIIRDNGGPAGALDLSGIRNVVDSGVVGLVQACGRIYDASRDGGLVHLGDPILENALASAATRILGDRWAWKRRTSSSDITPIVAATLALWGHAERGVGGMPMAARA